MLVQLVNLLINIQLYVRPSVLNEFFKQYLICLGLNPILVELHNLIEVLMPFVNLRKLTSNLGDALYIAVEDLDLVDLTFDFIDALD